MLPIHPQPLQDEIFSSWLVRLAFANKFPLHTFYSSLLRYKEPIWNRDSDRHPTPNLLNILSIQTGQSVQSLLMLTLMSYEGILFEQLPNIGNAPWVMPLGIYHRTRKSNGMQFCPVCLQADNDTAYYRRHWRLALCPICVQHGCLLHQHCPACGETIAFHRHGIGRARIASLNALFTCHHCSHDLRDVTPRQIPMRSAYQHNLVRLIESLNAQSWSGSPLGSTHPLALFQGLHALIQLLIGRHGGRLRARMRIALDVELYERREKRHVEFEHLNATTRLDFLWSACWLLEDWPNRFLDACAASNLSRSYCSENLRTLPFWLAQVIDLHLDRRPYQLTASEVISAGRYMTSQNIDVTPASLRKTLGLSRHTIGPAWSTWQRNQANAKADLM